MSTNVRKVYIVVMPTPFAITLWAPITVHADQDLSQTEETVAQVRIYFRT